MAKGIWPFEVNEIASGMIIIYNGTIWQESPIQRRTVPTLKSLWSFFYDWREGNAIGRDILVIGMIGYYLTQDINIIS